jgi:multidrug efflux pump subunit AcrB
MRRMTKCGSSFCPSVGAPFLQQYNQFPSVSVSGSAAPGVSSSTAMAAMAQILDAESSRQRSLQNHKCRIQAH